MEQAFQEEGEAEPTTTTRPPTATTAPTSTVAPFAPADTADAGQPLLGEPVGLTLIVGGVTTRAVGLDSGAITEIDIDGAPLLATDRWIVVANTEGGSSVVDRLEPLAPPRPLSPRDAPVLVAPDGPDHVWVLERPDAAAAQWSSVALLDGSSRTRLELTSFGWPTLRPEVGGTVSGGVFVLGEDRLGYRRVGEGAPLAASDEAILVRLCSSPDANSCRTFWVDRATGGEIDRFVPPITGSDATVEASPAGRFVVVRSDDSRTLWDLERQTQIASTLPGSDDRPVVGFSPGDRFAAFSGATSDQIVIYDSVSAGSHVLTLPDRRIRPYGLAFGLAIGTAAGE